MSTRDEDEDKNKHLYIFGTDIAAIPCFRNSFLYGISTGVVGGLAMFLRTSRPQFSTHCGFGTFMTTTLFYWFYCRYKWSADNFAVLQLQQAMKKKAIYEGTQIEKKLIEQSDEYKQSS